ncbi:MAG: hypothetical protein RMJ67_01385 [Elusimicrobiota bacterium]|nr:hypothetical protein [Endomicrobiia bacterium]MDW8165157.1 hypothetical protein [Elusimicrobiota bacterium]
MIERVILKFTSRKFLIWVIGTILLFLRVISEETWLYLTMFYVGTEGLADIVSRFKNDKE